MSPREATLVFERHVPSLGVLGLRRLRPSEDLPFVHAWVSSDRAKYWGMAGFTLEQVARGYADILRRADVFVGLRNSEPAFLIECYDPRRDAVGQHYPVRPDDRGMHVLIAPSDRRMHGYTWSVFAFVMEFVFQDAAVQRVVVEPDVRNYKIHALNHRAGFRYEKLLDLPGKTAHLAFCTREQFRAALLRETIAAAPPAAPSSELPLTHLQPEHWAAANEALLRKTLAELTHERIVQPRLERAEAAGGRYVLSPSDPRVEYRFRARQLPLDHWSIEVESIERRIAGERTPLDAVAFFIEFSAELGMDAEMLPVYLEEVASTLFAAAYKRANEKWASADLVHAGFQEVEAAMTDGHPCFVANSGRVGFDARDYVAYAPEVGTPIRLVWVAAHRRHTEFNAIAGLSYTAHIEQEVGAETIRRWKDALAREGLDPEAYLFLPVHPWQWFEKLAVVFAADIARRDLVCLGDGDDSYRAQQSIRTLFNASHPERHYVKTALSVLNMGFMRGLSAEYMRATPAINAWIHELIQGDREFERMGFGILRELAAIGYRQPMFEAVLPKASPHRKMLAALWRESPVPRLRDGQRLMTMASLLHRDRAGVALLPQLIRASGLDADAWLDRYLACYFAPLLHCFYKYDLAFMPHGENVILVLEANVPVRTILKDIAEEAAVMEPAAAVPEAVRRIVVPVPHDLRILSIFTDVFDCFFRFMSAILFEDLGYSPDAFWLRVASCASAYRREHPELADKLRRHDVFAPEFQRSCLNRLQLRNNRQMIDLSDPTKNLCFDGTLENPLAQYDELRRQLV